MLRTLFHVPSEIAGMPVFGVGLLLALWAIGSAVLMIWLLRRQGFNADTRGYVPVLLLIGALIWLVLPRLCERQGLPIHGYGVMLLLAVVSAVALAVWRGRRVGIDAELVFAMAFWSILPGIVGARLFYVLLKWPYEFAPVMQSKGTPALLGALINISQGGVVIYGAVIGGILGLTAFVYKYKLPLLATFDLATPSVMLGLAMGRLGCFLNGCCFGGVCDLPWAVTFPAGSPPHLHQVYRGQTFFHGLKMVGDLEGPPVITEVEPGSPAQQNGLKSGQQITSVNGRKVRTAEQALWMLRKVPERNVAISITIEGDHSVHRWPLDNPPARSEPVHPTQIYSSINALLLCLFLLAYDPFRRRDGELFAMMLTIYPIARFLLEMIRADEPPIFGTGLTIAQNVSLIMLVSTAGLWIWILRKPPGTAFATYQGTPDSFSAGPQRRSGS